MIGEPDAAVMSLKYKGCMSSSQRPALHLPTLRFLSRIQALALLYKPHSVSLVEKTMCPTRMGSRKWIGGGRCKMLSRGALELEEVRFELKVMADEQACLKELRGTSNCHVFALSLGKEGAVK